MTAPAARAAQLLGETPARHLAARALTGLFTIVLAMMATPAAAEVGAVVSAFSDDRFRGISLSDGRPVGILDLSYDTPDGFYGALSGSVVAARHEGLKGLGIVVNGGYATRLRSGLSVDFGAVNSRYSHYSGIAAGRAFTEVYAGLAGRFIGARLAVSPNYLAPTRWTAHGEINVHVDLTRRLLLDGEVGALVPFGSNSLDSCVQFDARLGLSQRVGPLTLHAAVTARGRGADLYAGQHHGRTAFVFGLSTAL